MSVLSLHTVGEVGARGPRPLPYTPWAIPWVLGFHGDTGVELFFVISGYILARPFLREHRLGGKAVELGKYYLRRVTRLEPPYILSLVLFAVGMRLGNHTPWSTMLPHFLASAVYLHSEIYQYVSTISFVTWSLEIEIQFYLIAPLLGQLFRIRDTALRRGVLVALIAGTAALTTQLTTIRLQYSILNFIPFFLTGFLLTDLLDYPRHEGGTAWGWDVLGLAAWVGVFHMPRTPVGLALLPVVLLPACWTAFHGRFWNWFFRRPFVALTGGMCYSIYLLHTLAMSTLFRAVEHVQFANTGFTAFVQITTLMAFEVLVGLGYYVLVERPCMDPEWPTRLWHWVTGRGARAEAQGA